MMFVTMQQYRKMVTTIIVKLSWETRNGSGKIVIQFARWQHPAVWHRVRFAVPSTTCSRHGPVVILASIYFCFFQPLQSVATHLRTSDSLTTMALYKSIYLLTYLFNNFLNKGLWREGSVILKVNFTLESLEW